MQQHLIPLGLVVYPGDFTGLYAVFSRVNFGRTLQCGLALRLTKKKQVYDVPSVLNVPMVFLEMSLNRLVLFLPGSFIFLCDIIFWAELHKEIVLSRELFFKK